MEGEIVSTLTVNTIGRRWQVWQVEKRVYNVNDIRMTIIDLLGQIAKQQIKYLDNEKCAPVCVRVCSKQNAQAK